ncbi:MAG TPA: DUF2125 domain-containing protein [Stellaceae bacterium]|jgi:hypothetical protein|nr:DUF2125 domain-containing protein [Stellaceae bacterium]
MRPRTLIALVLLLVLVGAYGAFWFIVSGRIEDEVVAQASSLRRQNLDLSWSAMRVGGFPFAFDVRLSEARLRGTATAPPPEMRAPVLSASARPWNFRDLHLSAPDGLSAAAGAEPMPKLNAQKATGAVAVGSEGDINVWLTLDQVDADLPEHVSVDQANVWLILPAQPPRTHTERALALAADLRGLQLPTTPAPFHGAVDDLGFGATVMGAIPAGPPRQAATGWRDSGGTVELDQFALRWGGLAVNGSGTLALGPDLQPMGAFSGAVSGIDELINALAAAGRLRLGDLTIARIALAALAKPGPSGRPEISTSFTIQDGQMFLGPAKLGPVPRIDW